MKVPVPSQWSRSTATERPTLSFGSGVAAAAVVVAVGAGVWAVPSALGAVGAGFGAAVGLVVTPSSWAIGELTAHCTVSSRGSVVTGIDSKPSPHSDVVSRRSERARAVPQPLAADQTNAQETSEARSRLKRSGSTRSTKVFSCEKVTAPGAPFTL